MRGPRSESANHLQAWSAAKSNVDYPCIQRLFFAKVGEGGGAGEPANLQHNLDDEFVAPLHPGPWLKVLYR